jgi:hypothetical protein
MLNSILIFIIKRALMNQNQFVNILTDTQLGIQDKYFWDVAILLSKYIAITSAPKFRNWVFIPNPGPIPPVFLKPVQAGFGCIEAISIASFITGVRNSDLVL